MGEDTRGINAILLTGDVQTPSHEHAGCKDM